MHNKKNPRCTALVAQSFPLMGLAAAIAMASAAAQAGETIEFDNGATLDWTITTSYGIGVRTASPDSALIDGATTATATSTRAAWSPTASAHWPS